MLQAFAFFAKRVLSFGKFESGSIPRKIRTTLLTGISDMLEHEVVMIKPIVKLVKGWPGRLVLDDTSNPKYGLKNWSRKLKILTHGGFRDGYKILLFLWECDLGRIPVGFALWHKGTRTLGDLALSGLSRLRKMKLKPEAVLADGAFSTDEILKRLENYGWPCVMRCNSRRKLENKRVDKEIGRGYGSEQGRLKNGTKVKIFRRKNRFFVCNRMLWTMQKAVSLYTRRWKIEEVFRAIKQCLGLNRCQQHSMRAQAIYLMVCFILFACLELNSGQSVYKLAQTVISAEVPPENILDKRIFKTF